jgi:hypothetical protein
MNVSRPGTSCTTSKIEMAGTKKTARKVVKPRNVSEESLGSTCGSAEEMDMVRMMRGKFIISATKARKENVTRKLASESSGNARELVARLDDFAKTLKNVQLPEFDMQKFETFIDGTENAWDEFLSTQTTQREKDLQQYNMIQSMISNGESKVLMKAAEKYSDAWKSANDRLDADAMNTQAKHIILQFKMVRHFAMILTVKTVEAQHQRLEGWVAKLKSL